ncbi:SGNH/GDSL hydrolase family protein [Microscilla marina]|uniref:Lipoprotein n=1 Tax=Microscilla marina ATCC 23134 TaxID=313606 RepID=A1ZSQ7_MICM2|nr:SGNH/GDSL hydrolase family protein [Microscilla marina]EAY26637.1 hypothetical protein M23134_06166 [Microscilla marina ATCC 23134]
MLLFLQKFSVIACVFICLSCQTETHKQNQQVPLVKVLFLGNSYTYYHRMPEMFTQLAQHNKKNVAVQSVASGGRRLQDHSRNRRVKKMIQEQNFNWVILQEQSIIPFVQTTQMYEAVRTIDTWAKQHKTQSMFFLFWARKHTHDTGIRLEGVPYYQRFRSFTEAQNSLVHTHKKIADELGIPIAPVGVVWQQLHYRLPQSHLWQADGSHPTKVGAYITALVFYASIFQELPMKHLHRCPLKPAEQQLVADIIKAHVLDRKEYWNSNH